jgi:hypothetical protein
MAPTYLLAPNTTTHPDGFPKIGTIIADPLQPFKTLLAPEKQIQLLAHTRNLELTTITGQTLNASIWAEVFQAARARLTAGQERSTRSHFTAPTLSTKYMQQYPTDEDAALVAAMPVIRATMNAGIGGHDPVYMITGLKVARGFGLEIERSSSKSASAGASVPLDTEVSAGLDAGGSKTKAYYQAGKSSEDEVNDIVFAYQLHVIARKGWLHKRYLADLHEPKGALLHEGKQSTRDEELETRFASLEDVQAFAEDNEEDPPRAEEILEDGQPVLYIYA